MDRGLCGTCILAHQRTELGTSCGSRWRLARRRTSPINFVGGQDCILRHSLRRPMLATIHCLLGFLHFCDTRLTELHPDSIPQLVLRTLTHWPVLAPLPST